MPPITDTETKLPPLPPQPAGVKPPEDVALLEQGLREYHPDVHFIRHGTNFALCQDPHTKQYVHVPHDNIRRKQGRLIDAPASPAGTAALAAENAALKARLDSLEATLARLPATPQATPDVDALVRRLSQLEAQLGVVHEAK